MTGNGFGAVRPHSGPDYQQIAARDPNPDDRIRLGY
jgi:hypothetical protein